jgi:membrane fusion protein (multidrug efflux system)
MVRAVSDNKDLKLVPGAFAHIEIPLNKEANAILIPTQAMVPDLKGQKVFISKNGIAEKKAIEIGIRNDSAIQVTSGLNPGDTLITTGMMQIRPGLPVVVIIE